MPSNQEAIWPLLFLLVVGGAIVLGIVVSANYQRTSLASALRQVTARYQGSVWPGGLFEDPHAQLQLDGRPALLQFVSYGKSDYRTRITLSWSHNDLRLELRPTTVFDQLGQFVGLEDIEIGAPEFDASYHITGNSRQRIRDLLSPAVQELLQAIGRLGTWAGGVHLEIGGGQLRLTCSGRLTEVRKLALFVQLGARFSELVPAQAAEGITFLPTTHADLAERPHCLVCGEALAGVLVSCGRCKTVHHRECWDYFGGCATYACGCKQHRPAAAPKRRAG